MKRVMTSLALLAVCAFVLGGAIAGGDKKEEKTHTVGKDGLKIESKLTEDEKRFEYKIVLEGNELDESQRNMRHKSYKVKLDGGTKYIMTVSAGDDEFDSLLVVLDGTGKILVYDDDGGAGEGKQWDSKLDFTPKDGGTFTIHVAGMRDTVGPYTLKIAAAKK
ncbi:MAG: hypothetical protein HY040_26375 [Planctomycetes bacterium]|nr:hypothetical protein [Planctomycetota bacterium]